MQNSLWVHVSCGPVWSNFQILDVGDKPGCTYSQTRMTPHHRSISYILISSWSKLEHTGRKGWEYSLSGPQYCVTQSTHSLCTERLCQWNFWNCESLPCLRENFDKSAFSPSLLATAFRSRALPTSTWLQVEVSIKTTITPGSFHRVG